jgi:hypothetical protein
VKEDEPSYPCDVGLGGSRAVVAEHQRISNALKERAAGPGRCGGGHDPPGAQLMPRRCRVPSSRGAGSGGHAASVNCKMRRCLAAIARRERAASAWCWRAVATVHCELHPGIADKTRKGLSLTSITAGRALVASNGGQISLRMLRQLGLSPPSAEWQNCITRGRARRVRPAFQPRFEALCLRMLDCTPS